MRKTRPASHCKREREREPTEEKRLRHFKNSMLRRSYPPLLDVINCPSNRIILLIFSPFYSLCSSLLQSPPSSSSIREKFLFRRRVLSESIMSNSRYSIKQQQRRYRDNAIVSHLYVQKLDVFHPSLFSPFICFQKYKRIGRYV